jgi:hypothetical protein
MGWHLGSEFWIVAGWLALTAVFLWITNRKHERTRRALRPLLELVIGAAIWMGLVD